MGFVGDIDKLKELSQVYTYSHYLIRQNSDDCIVTCDIVIDIVMWLIKRLEVIFKFWGLFLPNSIWKEWTDTDTFDLKYEITSGFLIFWKKMFTCHILCMWDHLFYLNHKLWRLILKIFVFCIKIIFQIPIS